jgi:cyanophycin synthetase
MKIEGFTTLFGPNVYSTKPLLGMYLDLDEYATRPSSTLPGFPERLAARLPGLIEHRCSRGYRGGFLERLAEGTYLGHICEHVALELSEAAGIPVHFGRTVSTTSPSVYLVLVAYKCEAAMRVLLEGAVTLVQAVIDDRWFDVRDVIEEARSRASAEALGPSTQCIVDAALARGIPVRRRRNSLVQLGWGKKRQLIQAALTGRTPHIAVDIASDKSLTKELLHEAHIPVPAGRELHSEQEIAWYFETFAPPLVVKPLDANQGKGVSLNVTSLTGARAAFKIAREYGPAVLLEEQFAGQDFRVLIVGNRMVAASERIPAHVVGDGRHSIRELVNLANRDPRRGTGHEKPLTELLIDPVTVLCLKRRGITLDSVPARGEKVVLRENANLSTGGEAHDVTSLVHPSIAETCVKAAQVIGLDIAGIDLITSDITRPLQPGEGIIEVNAAPGLRMHEHPSRGERVAAGRAIIDFMFPGRNDGRIPVVAITGTNGKTTTARLVAHMLAASGRQVGLTTTDGIYVDGKCITKSDAAGPHSASTILADPTVDAAVFECARGGIVRRGLAFDECDVAVITNICADHIGQDGIRDLDDLIWIKSLIAESVREGGTLIVNADDPGALAVLDRPRVMQREKKIILYSESSTNPVVRAHLAKSGYAFFARGEHIIEAYDSFEREVLRFRDLPITFGGMLRHNLANTMAALAAAQAAGVLEEIAIDAAFTFSPSDNPGRGNIYAVGDGYVMLDYGHNADAFAAIGKLRQAGSDSKLIGVIALPGDRADEIIHKAAGAAADAFDELFIREDDDLRGRRRGEIARMICRSIHEHRPTLRCAQVEGPEVTVLNRVLERAVDGNLVVFFYDKLAPLTVALEDAGARLVAPEEFAASWSRSNRSSGGSETLKEVASL